MESNFDHGQHVPVPRGTWTTSFGISAPDGTADADFGDRSGHTRVSLYVDWINHIINPGLGGGGNDGGGGGKNGGGPPSWAGGGKNKSRLALLDVSDAMFLRADGFALSGSAVPEPSTAAAGVLAFGALAMCSRRRRAV